MAVQRILPGLLFGLGIDETSQRNTITASSLGLDDKGGTPPPPPSGSNLARQSLLRKQRRPKTPKTARRFPIQPVVAFFLGKPRSKVRKPPAKKRRIGRRDYPLFRKHPGRRRVFFFD